MTMRFWLFFIYYAVMIVITEWKYELAKIINMFLSKHDGLEFPFTIISDLIFKATKFKCNFNLIDR